MPQVHATPGPKRSGLPQAVSPQFLDLGRVADLSPPRGTDPMVVELVAPDGTRLTIAMSRGGKRILPNLEYELSGKPRRDTKRRLWVYTYSLREGKRFVFEPGDLIWAGLGLQGGKLVGIGRLTEGGARALEGRQQARRIDLGRFGVMLGSFRRLDPQLRGLLRISAS